MVQLKKIMDFGILYETLWLRECCSKYWIFRQTRGTPFMQKWHRKWRTADTDTDTDTGTDTHRHRHAHRDTETQRHRHTSIRQSNHHSIISLSAYLSSTYAMLFS